MATKKKSIAKTPLESCPQEVSFWVEPGKLLKINLEVGETVVDGKVPVTLHFEQVAAEQTRDVKITQPESESDYEAVTPMPILAPTRQWNGLATLKSRLARYNLATWLFFFAVAMYLVTRLIGLTQFPIYFFTDEAIQSQSIADLIQNEYRDPSGVLFPTYFRNGSYYNLSASVYLQWLPVLLFGKSALATRVTSVLVTLIAAISVGIILRDIFQMKYWWAGTLFLSITPAWFLHSRTAFETAEFVAFYAGTLCAYLFYRYRSPRFLYLTIFLGALAFYSYSPAQMIVPLTALGLLISDWRYHWENRRTFLIGIGLALILVLPYIRWSISNPSTPFTHLRTLWSYWFEKIPLSEKFVRYFTEFGVGLSPWYWYSPNERDLSRHLMKDYGHIMVGTLPFALFGMAHMLRNLRQPSYRAIFITLVVSPAAAALVQASITRALVFVIPAAILTAIGLELALQWVENPRERLVQLSEGLGPTPKRIGAAAVILALAILAASTFEATINRLALVILALILAFQISGVLAWLARSFTRKADVKAPKFWAVSPALLAVSAFLVLSLVNVRVLNDALTNGPLWYRDYGLAGMQYGAFQIFDIIEDYLDEQPGTRIILSPDWTNGADTVARFFLKDPFAIELGSVRGHITQMLPLDDHTLFIMTPQEYDLIIQNEKFMDINVERIVPYPDGNPGFYFIRLRYVDNIDEIFAAEKAARQALRESIITMEGQEVKLRHSFIEGEAQDKWIALVFDNDPFTVAKTFEANPFVIEMTFPKPRMLRGFSIIIGSAEVQITLKCYSKAGTQPEVHEFVGQGTQKQPELSFDLSAPIQVEVLQVKVLDLHGPDNGKVHIWELKLR